MKIRFQAQVAKDPAHPEYMEDVLLTENDMKDGKQQVIVCDGASESYDSKTWANTIAREAWIADHFFPTSETFNDFALAYTAGVNYENLSWSKQAAFDRGSFTTLLKLKYVPEDSKVQITSIGDCEFFLLSSGEVRSIRKVDKGNNEEYKVIHIDRTNKLLEKIPYSTPAEFQQRPRLISTLTKANAGFTSENAETLIHEVPVKKGQYAFLMSDALAQMTLSMAGRDDKIWQFLLSFEFSKGPAQTILFENFIAYARKKMSLRVDDVSFVSVEF